MKLRELHPRRREVKKAREQRATRMVPKGKGQSPGWGEAPAQEVEMTMTPTVTKEVPADTRKVGKGSDRMEVAEVVRSTGRPGPREGRWIL